MNIPKEKYVIEGQLYVEPFAGGFNIMTNLTAGYFLNG